MVALNARATEPRPKCVYKCPITELCKQESAVLKGREVKVAKKNSYRKNLWKK
jgi:hypothetical protein